MKKFSLTITAIFIVMVAVFITSTIVRAEQPTPVPTICATLLPAEPPVTSEWCIVIQATTPMPSSNQGQDIPEVRNEARGPDYYWAILGKITAAVVGMLCVASLMLIGIVVWLGATTYNA